MERDWFAAYRNAETQKDGATWATRATESKNAAISEASDRTRSVAQTSDAWATRATEGASVAHVAQRAPTLGNTPVSAKVVAFQASSAPVALVAHVAHEKWQDREKVLARIDAPLPDSRGRWVLYRIYPDRIGQPSDEARTISRGVRSMRGVLVADNTVLIVTFPTTPPSGTLDALRRHAAGVLAVLHRESDERMGLTSRDEEPPSAA